MKDNKFYGTEEITSLSYLEFGAIDLNSSKKLVWDLKLHQKAYDWYMHARYSNDILYYLTTGEQLKELSLDEVIKMYNAEIHHKDDFSNSIGKLCALTVAHNNITSDASLSFFELGQTLFGCIEAIQFSQTFLTFLDIKFRSIDVHEVQWYGVDISAFFNRLSVLMHSGYKLHTSDDIKFINSSKDVFFAKGVTMLYAIRNISQLLDLLDTGKICIFDYSFAIDEEQEVIIGSGKVVKYLKFADFIESIQKLPRKMYVKKGNSFVDRKSGRVTIECFYADENTCLEFIKLDGMVRSNLVKSLSEIKDSNIFLDTHGERNSGWITLDEFVATEELL